MNRKCKNCNYCFNGECDMYLMSCDDAMNVCECDDGLMYNENKIDAEDRMDGFYYNFLTKKDWND